MRYGNCLLCILLLWISFGFRGRLKSLRREDAIIPHFMLYKDGWYYHYKCEIDILPWPFYYLIFKGKFVKQERLYTNEVIDL